MTQSPPSLCACVWIERTSLPPLGSVTASAELDVAGRAEALWRPLRELHVGRGLADRGERERGQHDRQPDAGAAPEQLFHDDRQRQAGRIGRRLRVELPVVEALLRGLLEHGPGQLLLAVVLRRNGPDDFPRKGVTLLAQLLLVVRELEVEGHGRQAKASGAVSGCSPLPRPALSGTLQDMWGRGRLTTRARHPARP